MCYILPCIYNTAVYSGQLWGSWIVTAEGHYMIATLWDTYLDAY